MNPDEQSEKYRLIGRAVEMIQKMPEAGLERFLEKLKNEISTETTAKDDRRNVRVNCFVSVDYADSKRVFKDYIEDISTSGVFIKTRETFTIGEEIVLSMSLSEEGSAFKIPAKVVRLASDGIGVKFKITSQVQSAIIESLLETIGTKTPLVAE